MSHSEGTQINATSGCTGCGTSNIPDQYYPELASFYVKRTGSAAHVNSRGQTLALTAGNSLSYSMRPGLLKAYVGASYSSSGDTLDSGAGFPGVTVYALIGAEYTDRFRVVADHLAAGSPAQVRVTAEFEHTGAASDSANSGVRNGVRHRLTVVGLASLAIGDPNFTTNPPPYPK